MMNDAVIRTEHLTKRYGRLVAVRDVTLEVPCGCVFALMGRNGAGKTSLIRMLLGLTPITNGRADVLGLPSTSRHVQIRRGVGYVPENHHMYPWMKIEEIAWFTSAFYPTWNDRLCRDLLRKFDLDLQKRIKELSRGMVAKVALVLALSHEPELLILDEPTSGLDAIVRKEFLESIVGVAADEGRSVLISSHILHDVERVTDRVALMDHGRITLVEDQESLKERMREARVTFAGAPPDVAKLPGVKSIRKTAHEWQLILDSFDAETPARLSAALPGASVEIREMDLEAIFVALVGNPKADAEFVGSATGDANHAR